MAQLILVLLPTSMLGLLAIALCLPRTAVAGETSATVTKVTTGAAYAGAATPAFMGLTGDEWQVVGVVGGLVLGLLTWIGNMVVNWHFKSQHLKLAREQMALGKVVAEGE